MKNLTAIVLLTGLSLSACTPAATSGPTSAAQAPVKDPYYAYFSDPSIRKPPPKDAEFGSGQAITIEYDGSKSKPSDTVFYSLYYVDPKGSVRPITGGSFDNKTGGVFTTSNKVHSSEANGRPGFMEVTIVPDAKVVGGEQGVTGKNVRLGMYPITIRVAP